MAQLAHELTLSPLRQRLRQLAGIARVIQLVEPGGEYPYSFVCFHITGYHRRRPDDTFFNGKNLIADLATLMDRLTAACPLPPQVAHGRLYDVASLARRFKVSTKTISRWRARGLAGCWYGGNGEKPTFAFTRRAVERFVARHTDLVRRGATFQLMGAEEKKRIVDRARELVATEKCSLHVVTTRLAAETGRAVETIRYTLRRFDRDHPEQALFDRVEQARQIDEATVIYQAFVAGASVGDLAARFEKDETEIRRTLTRVRAEQLISAPIRYIYNESFDAPDAAERILGDDAALARDDGGGVDETLARIPAGLPPYLRDLYRTPLLGHDEERCLFRRMNFLLHQAELLRQELSPDAASATAADIAAIDDLLERSTQVKNRIIQANLRLVVSIAKRHLHTRPSANLFELVSDGNIALIRAVEGFDYARGFRFSTYGSWAIMRSFARTVPEELQQIDRFQTGHDELLSTVRDHRLRAEAGQDADERIRSAVSSSLASLEDRERSIIEYHYGLADGGKARTLEEIGCELGISKERVRQIEMRALSKLRGALGEQGAELLAG